MIAVHNSCFFTAVNAFCFVIVCVVIYMTHKRGQKLQQVAKKVKKLAFVDVHLAAEDLLERDESLGACHAEGLDLLQQVQQVVVVAGV